MWKGRIGANTIHNNGLISLVDLAPTLLDLAGIPIPFNLYGKSFKPLLFDPQLRGRDFVFAERNWHDSDEYIRCVRTDKYKYIYNAYFELPHGTSLDLSTSPSWYSLMDAKKKVKLNRYQMQLIDCPRPMIEIYDLEKDPYELNNIADTKEGIEATKELPRLIEEWQKQTRDHPYWERRKCDLNDRVTGAPYYRFSNDFMNDY
jgi:arylsulfatase A-like enzyme